MSGGTKERRGRGGFWATELAPLRERPNQWVEYPHIGPTTAYKIRRGQMAGISEGEFEVAVIPKSEPTGRHRTVRIRFVGGG